MFVAARFGDVLGTELYERFGGFCRLRHYDGSRLYGNLAESWLLVPRNLIDTSDGQPVPPMT